MAGRQWIREALKDFVFSFQQGAGAAAKTPGARGGAASLAASIAAPQLRQDMIREQGQQDEERQFKIQQVKQAIATGDLQNVRNLIDTYGKTEGPQMNVQNPTMQQAPLPQLGMGDVLEPQANVPQPQNMGSRSMAMGSPPPIQLGGQTFQPQYANQARDQALQQFARQQEIVTDQNIRQTNATRPPVRPDTSVSPFEVWRQQNPGSSINDWIDLNNPKAKEDDTGRTTDKFNVDGKPTTVLKDKNGNFFDATTKQPITGRITPYVEPPSPRQRGEITPTAEAGLIQSLNTQWNKASKDVQELYRANTIMDSGMAAARKGDMNAGSQAVLVTFQKFLDPTSVVRESEYARSGQGLAMAQRIRGWYEKNFATGGAGVPLAELEAFAKIAKEINTKLVAEGNSLLSAERKRITSVADRYNVPPEMVIPQYDLSQAAGAGTPTPSGGGQPKTMILNGKTLTLGADGKYH